MFWRDRKTYQRTYTLRFDDGRIWKNVKAADLAGWAHYPFGSLNADVYDSDNIYVGRI